MFSLRCQGVTALLLCLFISVGAMTIAPTTEFLDDSLFCNNDGAQVSFSNYTEIFHILTKKNYKSFAFFSQVLTIFETLQSVLVGDYLLIHNINRTQVNLTPGKWSSPIVILSHILILQLFLSNTSMFDLEAYTIRKWLWLVPPNMTCKQILKRRRRCSNKTLHRQFHRQPYNCCRCCYRSLWWIFVSIGVWWRPWSRGCTRLCTIL